MRLANFHHDARLLPDRIDHEERNDGGKSHHDNDAERCGDFGIDEIDRRFLRKRRPVDDQKHGEKHEDEHHAESAKLHVELH